MIAEGDYYFFFRAKRRRLFEGRRSFEGGDYFKYFLLRGGLSEGGGYVKYFLIRGGGGAIIQGRRLC